MLTIQYSCDRIETILEQIAILEQSEFPYEHSREALGKLRHLFEDRLDKLRTHPSDSDPDVTRTLCATILSDVFLYVPLLGFILGSTEVRNAFELYPQLLRLARQVLGENIRLILSSEWGGYSPFTIREITGLKDFVLIGLPVPESQNPLLIPLAGHELGHNVWRSQRLAEKYQNAIEKDILDQVIARAPEYRMHFDHDVHPGGAHQDIFVYNTVAHFVQHALKQTEEYFCDFVGLYIFDAAYLHAFAYLLAPGLSGERSFRYPNYGDRVNSLIKAADFFRYSFGEGYSVPQDYADLFKDQTEPSPRSSVRFLLSLADHASGSLTSTIMREVQELLSFAGIPQLPQAGLKKLLSAYRFAVPTLEATSLAEILNAAWQIFHDAHFWEHLGITSRAPRLKILKELVLKNIEVLEIKSLVTGQ